jgi:hypothetical protein
MAFYCNVPKAVFHGDTEEGHKDSEGPISDRFEAESS